MVEFTIKRVYNQTNLNKNPFNSLCGSSQKKKKKNHYVAVKLIIHLYNLQPIIFIKPKEFDLYLAYINF